MAGREVAQVPEEPQQASAAREEAGGEEAELAKTGFDMGLLALIGALCVAASIVLFRRRKSA